MSAVVGVVFTGDSLTFPSFSNAYQWAGVPAASIYDEVSAPRKGLRAFPSAGVIFANWGLSGWRISDLETQASELDALICTGCPSGGGRPRREYVLVVRIGTNVTHNDPAVQAARLRTYCLARQAAGWHVVVCPIPSRTDGMIANFDTVYGAPHNAITAAWTASDGVAAVVPYSDSEMYGINASTSENTYWSNDKVHPKEAGHTRLKDDLAAVLNPLITSLQA